MSFSIAEAEEYRIRTYLQGLKGKGITPSRWIVDAIVRKIEYEEEQARKPPIEKPLVGGALAACCAIDNGNGHAAPHHQQKNKRQLTEDELDDQRLLAMRSKKYQLQAHELYHIQEMDPFERLPGRQGDEMVMAYLRYKQKVCAGCRQKLKFKEAYYHHPAAVLPGYIWEMTEDQKKAFQEAKSILFEKYGIEVQVKGLEEEEEKEVAQPAEMLPPPSPTPTGPPPPKPQTAIEKLDYMESLSIEEQHRYMSTLSGHEQLTLWEEREKRERRRTEEEEGEVKEGDVF